MLSSLHSSSTDLLQVFTGLATILVPCGFHSRSCLVVFFRRYQESRCRNGAFYLPVVRPFLSQVRILYVYVYRHKRFRPSGSWRGGHLARRRDLFNSRAGHAKRCLRFLIVCSSYFRFVYLLVGDWQSQL